MSELKPSHIAYLVRGGGMVPDVWRRVGAAWAHTCDKGYLLELKILAPGYRIVLLEPDQKPPAKRK